MIVFRATRRPVDLLPAPSGVTHPQDRQALWSGGLAATARWTAERVRRLEAGEYQLADDA